MPRPASEGQTRRRLQKILQMTRTTAPNVVLEVLADKMARKVRLSAQKFRVKTSARNHSTKRPEESPDTLRKDAKFFFFDAMGGTKEQFLSTLYAEFPQTCHETVASANRILRHEFDLLGSGPVHLGARIDWQRDFKTGKKWE